MLKLICAAWHWQAALQTAWDVVSVEEGQLSDLAWSSLCCVERALGHHIRLEPGSILHKKDDVSRQFYIVLEVTPPSNAPTQWWCGSARRIGRAERSELQLVDGGVWPAWVYLGGLQPGAVCLV
jgi:hypothetical protein